MVIVKREPAKAPGEVEWCEFEERPGPALVDAQEVFILQFFSPEKVVTSSMSIEVDLPAMQSSKRQSRR